MSLLRPPYVVGADTRLLLPSTGLVCPAVHQRPMFVSFHPSNLALLTSIGVLCVLFLTDVASTSPSNSHGFVSSSVSSTNSSMMDYEVEVVEIRVREGELNDIIP